MKYIHSIESGILPFEEEILSKKDQFNETIMTGLRTIWGIQLAKINDKFGIEYKNVLLQNADKHLINETLKIIDNTLLITDKGKFFADGIASDLFVV